MIGFAVAISVEVTTGKGLLEVRLDSMLNKIYFIKLPSPVSGLRVTEYTILSKNPKVTTTIGLHNR